MEEREYKQTPDWPTIITPLTGDELAEIWQDGEQRQGPLSVLGGVPSAHAASHKFGGTDVVGTQDKTANAIPITDGSGTLDVFVSDSSTTVKGKVQLATDGESAANKATQSNDARLSNARTPTAHAGSHLGGTDDLGLGTAAFLDSGVANGVTPLNSSGQVDSAFLPSYVDDVIEVANYAALPVTGETGKIYVTLDDNLTYRWSGTVYVEISKSLALGETSSTAYRGDRGKTAYDHSQIVTGNPHGTAITDIATLSGKITPLSDLSRVMRINGDGVPTFPDNVAGEAYRSNFLSLDGWGGVNGGVVTSQNGYIRVAVTNASYAGIARSISINAANAKTVRIKYRYVSGPSSVFFQWYNGSYTAVGIASSTEKNGTWQYADIPVATNAGWSGTVSVLYIQGDTSATYVMDIADISIGSGLYDTPVYGNDGQVVAVNHGVVPVNGKRGNALLFQGAHYLESLVSFVGTSGCISFRYARRTTGKYEHVISQNVIGSKCGVSISFTNLDCLSFVYGDGSTALEINLIAGMLADGVHTYSINFTPTTVGPVYRDGVQVFSQVSIAGTIAPYSGVMRIGCSMWSLADALIGQLYDVEYRLTPMTQDDAIRYHNGDDAVDSQQKSVTPVPHSIVTRKSDGRTEVANATEALDAINKGQLDAACSDFLMQSYTAGSTFTAGQLGYLHTDGKVYLFDANAEASAKGALYIAVGAVTANNIGTFQRGGEFTTTGLTVGAIYYGSETAGAITTTPPTTSGAIVRKIGFAQSSTVLFFNPSNDYVVLA